MEQTSLSKLVSVLEQMPYDEVPPAVLATTKECIADFLGVFCSSTQKPASHALRGTLTENGDLPDNAEDIAMWMAASARLLDMDDGHRFAMGHPGVVINAAAAAMVLTLPEGQVTGKTLIEAVAKGYEVYCWQGRVINPSAYLERGLDATSVCGAGAAAAVAGTLLGLNSTQMADAISLAASVAGGLNQSSIDGSAQKYLLAGFGAKIGIAAAEMAAHGLGGPSHVFEGKLGYVNAFSGHPNQELLMEPKLQWDIQSVYLKVHACVRRIHATLDAVNLIMAQEKLTAADIEKITVLGGQFLVDAGTYDPKDAAQAQTSVPYTVANLLKYGLVRDDLLEEGLHDPELAALSRLVTMEKDAEISAMAEKDKSLWGAAKVRIETKSGGCFELTKLIPDGDRESPFPEGTIKRKFAGHVESVAGAEYAGALWNELAQLEEVKCPARMLKEMLCHVNRGESV